MPIPLQIDVTDEELEEVVACIRMFLRDYATNNILLDDVQFKDKEVRRAIRLVESEFNAIPPLTATDWRQIPEAMLFLGVGRWLMLSESFLQIRNQVSVQTDGLGVVGIDDKHNMYASQAQMLRNDFMQQAKELKVSKNLESGYGGMSSGYANVSRFQHS